MILMNKEKISYYIFDSTAIIHFTLIEELQLEKNQILLPASIKKIRVRGSVKTMM